MTSDKRPDVPLEMGLHSGFEESIAGKLKQGMEAIAPFVAECFCIIEKSPDGILNFEFHFRSGIFLGHSEPDISHKGTWLFEQVAASDQDALQKVIKKALSGTCSITEVRIKDVNGADRICRVTSKPEFDDAGGEIVACVMAISELATSASFCATSADQTNTPTIVDSVLSNFVVVDQSGIVISFSGRAKTLLKIAPEENLNGRKFLEIFSSSTQSQNLIGNKEYCELELMLADSQHGEKWLQVCSFPIEKSSSSRGANFIVLRDITCAKLSRKALADSEEKFRALAENSPGVIFLEVDRRIVYVNSRCAEYLGYTPEEMLHQDFDPKRVFNTASSLDLKKELKEKLPEDGSAGIQKEITICRKDGETRNCILSVQGMAYQGMNAYLGIITDVTHIQQTNRKLLETRKRYWALFEAASDAIFVETLDGTILDCNLAGEKCYGYSRAELMGMNAKDLVPGDFAASMQTVAAELGNPGNSGKTLHIVATGRKKDGTIFPVEVSICGLTFNDEKLYLVTVRDISHRRELETARKRYDSQLQQIQLLDSFGTVVNGLANDFNNLLTGIMGYADLILRDLSPASPVREKARKIVEASRKGGEIIQQLVTSTGKLPAHFQKSNLNNVIKESIADLTRMVEKNGLLTCSMEGNLPEIVFDSTQIKLAIENLLKNSMEATEGKNGNFRLSVSLGQVNFYGTEIGYFGPPIKAGEYVAITVTDNGCGICGENLTKIFEPFFSTKYSSRGLGLVTVLSTVRSHHGAILVESVVNEGSEFSLMIPCQIDQKKEESFSPNPNDEIHPAGSILIVDDDESVSEVLSAQLQMLGYETFKAFDGNQGLEVFKRLNRRLSLVILDLAMPGKTGVELLKELRWLNPEIPVIICTGTYEIDGDLNNYGVSAILNKPFQLADVEKALMKVQIGK